MGSRPIAIVAPVANVKCSVDDEESSGAKTRIDKGSLSEAWAVPVLYGAHELRWPVSPQYFPRISDS